MKADCHIHMVLDGLDWKLAIACHKPEPNKEIIRKTLAAYREKGYTYLRDGGDRFGVCDATREMAGEYGITYRSPGAPLYHKGHYGSFIGTGFSDLREYTALVQAKREKADFLKIMISGLMDFDHFGTLTEPGLDTKTIREMIHIGREEGFSIMAHANGAETVLAAVDAGAASIEHGAYLNGEALSAMAETGCVWVPTLSPVGNLIGTGRFPDRDVTLLVENFLKNLQSYVSMGGLTACGSDAGAWNVPHAAETEEAWLKKVPGLDTEPGNARIKKLF